MIHITDKGRALMKLMVGDIQFLGTTAQAGELLFEFIEGGLEELSAFQLNYLIAHRYLFETNEMADLDIDKVLMDKGVGSGMRMYPLEDRYPLRDRYRLEDR